MSNRQKKAAELAATLELWYQVVCCEIEDEPEVCDPWQRNIDA